MSRIIYILFIVLGGASAAVQSPVNSGLGKRIGVFEGGFWSFATGTLLLLFLVLLFGKGDFFILRTKGLSMIEAGIEPGDMVVVRKQNSADEGDIVVALVNNETTLKRYYIDKKKRCVRLHPENKDMDDILTKECYIQGVAQHVIKAL